MLSGDSLGEAGQDLQSPAPWWDSASEKAHSQNLVWTALKGSIGETEVVSASLQTNKHVPLALHDCRACDSYSRSRNEQVDSTGAKCAVPSHVCRV